MPHEIVSFDEPKLQEYLGDAFSQVKVDSSLCRFPTLRPGHACAPSFRYQRA